MDEDFIPFISINMNDNRYTSRSRLKGEDEITEVIISITLAKFSKFQNDLLKSLKEKGKKNPFEIHSRKPVSRVREIPIEN